MNNYHLDVYCPRLRYQADAGLIQEALSHAPGLISLSVDWNTHHVQMTVANQDGGGDAIRRLDECGFPAAGGIKKTITPDG